MTGICAWCRQRLDPDNPEAHSRLCAALWEAQSTDAPSMVQRAAQVLYWWVQEKVGHYPRAAELRERVEQRQGVLI